MAGEVVDRTSIQYRQNYRRCRGIGCLKTAPPPSEGVGNICRTVDLLIVRAPAHVGDAAAVSHSRRSSNKVDWETLTVPSLLRMAPPFALVLQVVEDVVLNRQRGALGHGDPGVVLSGLVRVTAAEGRRGRARKAQDRVRLRRRPGSSSCSRRALRMETLPVKVGSAEESTIVPLTVMLIMSGAWGWYCGRRWPR